MMQWALTASQVVARCAISRRGLLRSAASVTLTTILLSAATSARAQQEEPSSPRARTALTILQLNDVYSTVPIDDIGGLARVATLRSRLAAAGLTPLVLMAGDFLSPSVASSIFKGEQMVAALNAAGLDIATLGNHEFDFGPDVLLQRMREARWQWVISNVIDSRTNQPVGGAPPYVVRTFGPLKVGVIGLCLDGDEISEVSRGYLRITDPLEAAATYLPRLKAEGANLIVALTHLTFADDRALAARFPEIDLIVGGHEHYPITAVENRTLISKAGSDARFVARLDLNRRDDGTIERFFELIPITATLPDDPAAAAVINGYETRLSAELDVVVGSTTTALDADSVRIRAAETNLGNFFADALRAEVGADVAIVNSGGIRGDRVYPVGPLARRTLLAIHPFGGVVCKLEMSGRDLLTALNNGVSRLPATDGRFPQISGMTMTASAGAPSGNRVSNVIVGGLPLDLDRRYTVAVTDYQVEGGDGYDIFKTQRVLVSHESGPLIVTALEKFVVARRQIAPQIEGRITIVR